MGEIAIQRGLYFEEFNLGDSVTSAGRTVTEADIVAFAGLSGDWNAIHTDVEFCKETCSVSGSRTACSAYPSLRAWRPVWVSSRAR